MQMLDVSERRGVDWEWRTQFVSDVFHALSQPLTALHCSLELALLKKSTAEQQRKAMEDALLLVQRAIESARLVRVFAEAENPGQPELLRLGDLLSELVEELRPVAQQYDTRLILNINHNATIVADKVRLRESLFYLLDAALQDGCTDEIVMDCRAEGQAWVLEFKSNRRAGAGEIAEGSQPDSHRVFLAEKIIAALGGECTCRQEYGRSHCVLRFPVAIGPSSDDR